MDLLKNLDNMITAESFINQWITKPLDNNDVENLMIEFAKLHVKAALIEASEYAEIEEEFIELGGEYKDVPIFKHFINKKSILHAYPLENIK